MTKTRFAFPLLGLAALLLAACASPTAYAPASRVGGTGYASAPVAPGVWQVSFRGNSLTSRATVEDYLLFRAAELTLQQGYDGFTLIRSDTERDTRIRARPRYGAGYYPGFSPYWGWWGRPYGYRYWSPFYGDPFLGGVDYDTIDSYQAYATIGMYRGARREPGSFDARAVANTLGPRIRFPER